MAYRILGHLLYRGIVLMTIVGALTACGQTSGGGMFQTGQLVGGGTKEIRDVQPVAGFFPNAPLLQPGGAGRGAPPYRHPTPHFSPYNKIIPPPWGVSAQPRLPLYKVPPRHGPARGD